MCFWRKNRPKALFQARIRISVLREQSHFRIYRLCYFRIVQPEFRLPTPQVIKETKADKWEYDAQMFYQYPPLIIPQLVASFDTGFTECPAFISLAFS
jgi:hypothetical protein